MAKKKTQCEECEFNKEGRCLNAPIYIVNNRLEKLEYKPVKDIKECLIKR